MLQSLGGICFAHGPHGPEGCPKWPACATDPQVFKPSQPSPAGEQEAREWLIEQNGAERILCYWYTPEGGNRMKREVAVMCDWNGKEDQQKDEKLVLDALHDAEFSHLRKDADYQKFSDELNHSFRLSAEAEKKAEKHSDVIEWLRERHENAINISRQKVGADQIGWLEDAAYYEKSIAAILREE
jgi:hypothetical protein